MNVESMYCSEKATVDNTTISHIANIDFGLFPAHNVILVITIKEEVEACTS